MEYKGFTYTPAPKTAWDNLSMLEKSEMMKVAVRNGITDLKTIREKYNEFAEGGDTKWTMEDEAKYMEWRQSLPDNLRLTNDSDYDMRAAFKASMQPTLEADGLYHLRSRDPETGRILKAPHHPTYLQAINTDARMGYYPVVDDKGQTYTQTWEGNKFGGGGGFASLITMPMILPRDTEGGKKQRKVLQFLPVVGTAVNAEEAVYNPTQYNIVRTGISAASDLFGLSLWRGAKAGVQLVKGGLPTTKEVMRDVTSPWTRNEVKDVFRTGLGYGLPLADTEMDILENTKAKGGKIHIKPSHRGRLTELKARTGKTEAELYNDGNPAHKKMVVFARNARKWHGEGGPLQGPIIDMAMANIYGDGGEEVTAFTPIKKPVIPIVEGDQEAVQWLANWYNNRREQMYDNLKDYDERQTFIYDLKDRLTGNPIGRRAVNHDYYNKLNNMARYKTATFDDLERDNTASFDMLSGNAFGITVPETGKIYYDNDRIKEATSLQNKQEGYSPLGVHIHERTHSSGMTGDDGKFTGYNVQTKALADILRLKDGVEYDEYLDAMPEVYGRMMEFRYNHNLNPKKRYNKQEIKKLLDKENKGYKSELQRYDLNTLTKALNDVANVGFTNPFSPLYS